MRLKPASYFALILLMLNSGFCLTAHAYNSWDGFFTVQSDECGLNLSTLIGITDTEDLGKTGSFISYVYHGSPDNTHIAPGRGYRLSEPVYIGKRRFQYVGILGYCIDAPPGLTSTGQICGKLRVFLKSGYMTGRLRFTSDRVGDVQCSTRGKVTMYGVGE